MVDGLSTRTQGITEFHCIIQKCRSLLNSISNSRVSVVRWKTNQVVHTLARISRFCAKNHVFERISNCIHASILNEMQ